MVVSSRVRQERLRVGWSARSWLICSCTMLLICGWRGAFRPSRSRDTQKTSSATAEAKRKPARFGMPWRSASGPAGWFFIPQRRSSSIARTRTGVATIRSSRLTSSVIPFDRERAAWRGGRYGTSFLPAASPDALKTIRQTIRRLAFHHRTDKSLEDLAQMYRPYIQGWITYYSHFYKSELTPTLHRIDAFLIRWARNKFKRLHQRPKGARDWLARVIRANPHLFAHWRFLHGNGRTSGAV